MVNYQFYEYVPKAPDTIQTGIRRLNTFNPTQLENVKNNSTYFSLLNTYTSPLSTYVYALTTQVNLGTTNFLEWGKNIELLNNRTIFNFTSSFSLGLSSFSYVWETSARVNFNDIQFLQQNILSIPNYRKGETISYVVSSIEYKASIDLEKRFRTESVIDWDNPQTTLPLSKSENSWYNTNGIIETMINYELQKGLGLI
jgi:hypothetical protein